MVNREDKENPNYQPQKFNTGPDAQCKSVSLLFCSPLFMSLLRRTTSNYCVPSNDVCIPKPHHFLPLTCYFSDMRFLALEKFPSLQLRQQPRDCRDRWFCGWKESEYRFVKRAIACDLICDAMCDVMCTHVTCCFPAHANITSHVTCCFPHPRKRYESHHVLLSPPTQTLRVSLTNRSL
jgi:hypothetical protein